MTVNIQLFIDRGKYFGVIVAKKAFFAEKNAFEMNSL